MKIAEYIAELVSGILRLLFAIIYPEKDHCLSCGSELFLPEVSGLCSECLQQIDFVTDFCQHCGRKISREKELCLYCQAHLSSFDRARSTGIYDGLFRDLILNYKYNGARELAVPLANLLKLIFYEYYKKESIDYLLAVPLHKRKLELRGFNQAGLLAAGLSAELEIPVLQGSLLRIDDSPALYNLGRRQREQVINGVFKFSNNGYINNNYETDDNRGVISKDYRCSDSPEIEDKNILLIDDIYTTGTTVNEAAGVLKNNGAKEVYVLTLATADLT